MSQDRENHNNDPSNYSKAQLRWLSATEDTCKNAKRKLHHFNNKIQVILNRERPTKTDNEVLKLYTETLVRWHSHLVEYSTPPTESKKESAKHQIQRRVCNPCPRQNLLTDVEVVDLDSEVEIISDSEEITPDDIEAAEYSTAERLISEIQQLIVTPRRQPPVHRRTLPM